MKPSRSRPSRSRSVSTAARFLGPALALLASSLPDGGQAQTVSWRAPEHQYREREPQSPFTPVAERLKSGEIELRHTSDKEFVEDLLELMEIPVSSQRLVFSKTSLQFNQVSLRTPRALYFNEETYVAYVPGGQLEVISVDPELGAIFYLVDFPDETKRPAANRAGQCMNCHATADTRRVPGLTTESVIPGRRGGAIVTYRSGEVGHEIPLEDRFGGWYLTGAGAFSDHRGNTIARYEDGGIATSRVEPGTEFDWALFPTDTSDLLAHLVHEHQAGFVNRVTEAHYRLRSLALREPGPEVEALRRGLADDLVAYLLFAEEAPLPEGGLALEGAFRDDFLAGRIPCREDRSLRDLDLETRLFRHRCSYLIYRPIYLSLPDEFRALLRGRILSALDPAASAAGYDHLSAEEKLAILRILSDTHPDFAPVADNDSQVGRTER